MEPAVVVDLVKSDLLPKFRQERQKLDKIDGWARWDHDKPHKPRQATTEYKQLGDRAQAPWGDLIVTSVAQTLYVEGYRRPDAPDDGHGWEIWQANGMDARQVALHRAALTFGLAYGTCVPGKTMTGKSMPVMRCESPRQMMAFYEDPSNDDWPIYAIRVAKLRRGWQVTLYDAEQIHVLHSTDRDGDRLTYDREATTEHPAGVCPVVRYKNRFDLEGRAAGEIEPFIPVLGKIDQTSFDRLVVQRFASWVVRTISGMSVASSAETLGVSVDEAKFRLQVSDILTAEDHEAKFGSLPATPLDGFIKAYESDLTVLAAVSQTPSFEMLGQMANLSADALAAAKSSQTAKSDEHKRTFGEDHEQFIRLGCHVAGDEDGAEDFRAQVRWADTSIRSLAQAADALGKLVQMLGVPAEVLWPKIPNFSQQDVDEAKEVAESGGGIVKELLAGLNDASGGLLGPDGKPISSAA